MKVKQLIEQLQYYNPEAKLSFIVGVLGAGPIEVPVLSIYSEKNSPGDMEVCIDLGSDG